MAAAAGMGSIGVTWGYHSRDRLSAASLLIDGFAELPGAVTQLWEGAP